jgi:hypothetical protein
MVCDNVRISDNRQRNLVYKVCQVQLRGNIPMTFPKMEMSRDYSTVPKMEIDQDQHSDHLIALKYTTIQRKQGRMCSNLMG